METVAASPTSFSYCVSGDHANDIKAVDFNRLGTGEKLSHAFAIALADLRVIGV